MQSFGILPPPLKMKFSRAHTHFSCHFKILENNSFQRIIFVDLFLRRGKQDNP